MCSSTCARPRWSSASSIDPALTARRRNARSSGSSFLRMKNVSPFGSVPVRTSLVSGSGAERSGAEPTCARATARRPATAATGSSRTARYAARMRLNIKRLDSTIPLPTYGTDEAAGFDLASAHDLTVRPREIALVRTGLIIEVPTGHCLAIFARSSTPLKRGLQVANGVGIIDPDYNGPADEVMIQVLNFTGADVQIRRSEEHTSELQSLAYIVCRLLLEKKNTTSRR